MIASSDSMRLSEKLKDPDGGSRTVCNSLPRLRRKWSNRQADRAQMAGMVLGALTPPMDQTEGQGRQRRYFATHTCRAGVRGTWVRARGRLDGRV